MTTKQKIYFIIQQRKIVSLQDLYDITQLKPYTVLSAVSHLAISRKIRAINNEGTRYFAIKDKSL